jgi:hypothetical protein
MKRTTILGLVFLASTAAASGCGNDFAPYNRLGSLRVLAVQSEPAAPFTNETATLTPLVFTPTPTLDPTLTYAWSWCPIPGSANAGYPCAITYDQLTLALPAAQAATIPPFDLGAQPTATFPNTIDPAVLTAICGGTAGVPISPDCTGGFPIQITLTVTTYTDTGAVNDSVITVDTIRLRFTPTATLNPAVLGLDQPNANPVLADLTATVPAGGTPASVLDTAPPVTLPRDVETTIAALLPGDQTDATPQAESYTGTDDQGNVGTIRERLIFTWFVESGDTHDRRTDFIDGTIPLTQAQQTTWTPAVTKDYPAGTARLLVVLRDSRGGVGWKTGSVQLEDQP